MVHICVQAGNIIAVHYKKMTALKKAETIHDAYKKSLKTVGKLNTAIKKDLL